MTEPKCRFYDSGCRSSPTREWIGDKDQVIFMTCDHHTKIMADECARHGLMVRRIGPGGVS